MLRCSKCGRDLDAIGSDNYSYIPGSPLCAECAGVPDEGQMSYQDYLREEYEREMKEDAFGEFR